MSKKKEKNEEVEKPDCLTCGSEKVVKNGFRYGKQCWMCKECKSQHVENPEERGIDAKKEKLLRKLMSEKLSIRAITRVLEVSRNTVVKHIRAIENEVPENLSVKDSEDINLAEDDVEIDEIWTFVGRRTPYQAYWIWIAVHRKTKQVLGFVAGNREAETFKELWDYLVKIGVKGPIHTDGYAAYSKVIPKSQHVVHIYDGGTNLVEGLNTRWRAFCSRLVRKTTAYSKVGKYLRSALRFLFNQYNLSLC